MLNTMCGEVWWMNTLTQERWKTWKLNKVLTTTGHYLPYYIEVEHQSTAPEASPIPQKPSTTSVQSKSPARNKNPQKHSTKIVKPKKTRLNPITNLKINFRSFNNKKRIQ